MFVAQPDCQPVPQVDHPDHHGQVHEFLVLEVLAHLFIGVLSDLAPLVLTNFGHRRRRSSCRQDSENDRGFLHMPPAPPRSRIMLPHSGSAPEKVSKFVIAAAVAYRRVHALQSRHRSTSTLDAAMVLFKSVGYMSGQRTNCGPLCLCIAAAGSPPVPLLTCSPNRLRLRS